MKLILLHGQSATTFTTGATRNLFEHFAARIGDIELGEENDNQRGCCIASID